MLKNSNLIKVNLKKKNKIEKIPEKFRKNSRIIQKISFSKADFSKKSVFQNPNFAENQFVKSRIFPKISFRNPNFRRK